MDENTKPQKGRPCSHSWATADWRWCSASKANSPSVWGLLWVQEKSPEKIQMTPNGHTELQPEHWADRVPHTNEALVFFIQEPGHTPSYNTGWASLSTCCWWCLILSQLSLMFFSDRSIKNEIEDSVVKWSGKMIPPPPLCGRWAGMGGEA